MSIKFADTNREYEKDEQLKRDDVKSLLDWSSKQRHLPQITELQAILFLQSCYYSNEAAKTALDNYFTMRTLCPDVFGYPEFNDPLLKRTLDVAFVSILPKKTPEGYTVMLLKLIDCNPIHYDFVYQAKYFGMITMLHLHLSGTDKGLILLYDMEGGVLGHLSRVNFVAMKQYLSYLQDAMPIRLVGLHYINVIPFMDKIMTIVKPFMNKELINVMHFHTESIESLYKFVPKHCLPEEYGGESGAISTIHQKTKDLLIGNADFFKWHDKQLVDETKRQGKPKNSSDFLGTEGTFKKLEVD